MGVILAVVVGALVVILAEGVVLAVVVGALVVILAEGVVLAVGVVAAVIVAAVLAAVVADRPVLITPLFLSFVLTAARLQLVGPLLQPGSGL